MTRINEIRTIAKTWGNNASTLFFAAVLIVCSVTVGCSSDKPKPVTSNNQIACNAARSPAANHARPSRASRGQAGSEESRPQETSNRQLHRQELWRDLRISAPLRH